MAEVFLAKAAGPMGFEKTLVVKRILPELAEEPAFVQMFLSEAKLAARLTHPNIAQIFDFGEADGAYFLAMEYIDGPSLRQVIKRAATQGVSLPPTLCARLISHACEGLAFAHDFVDPDTGEQQGLIHRDVSPDNILLSRQGAVKVVDFGIAKAAGQSHKTESGVIKGKIAYMPPEQLRAKPLDRRADVYALGVVLYELLTGQRPYASDSEAGLMQAIIYEPPIPAARVRPDLPQPLRRILSKALSKEREQRYADCHAFQADLEAYIVSVGRPVTAQQVAQFINQTVSKTDFPALTPAPVPTLSPPRPALTPPPEPPHLVRKRTSSPSNEVVTANHRGPQPPKEEEPRALVTPPPRRREATPPPQPRELMTAQLRPPRPSQSTPPPPSSDVDTQEQEPGLVTEAPAVWRPVQSAQKPQSVQVPQSTQKPLLWVVAALLLATCGVGVSWQLGFWPKPALVAETESVSPEQAVAEPSEPDLSPPSVAGVQHDAGVPDAGNAVASAPPVTAPAPTPAPAQPQSQKTPAPAAPTVTLEGTLVLRIFPYATVFVDGKKWGTTPMKPLKLTAGRHTLKLVNEKLAKTVQRDIDIKAGKSTTLKLDLSEE
ncbi:protein kinase [Archangium minus]|uniref:Protein kinase n=2 Tax=Archangium minus TaxID=83450 RepID=A0ABY9XBS1_9BACT|nr:protein kinase [Archangium minus]